MTTPSLSSRQQQLAAASAAATASVRAGEEALRGKPAAAGDRYLLAATAGLPVEWVLLERHRERPQLLAVLADTHPLVGSADFVAPAGALRLRGGATVWIEESALDSALRVGALDPVTLEKARRKILERPPSSPEPEVLSRVDASPEYREWWRETLAPALAVAGVRAVVAPPREIRRPPLLALAAAALLLLAVGLAGWNGWRQRQEPPGREALRAAGEVPATEPRLGALLNVPVAILSPAELLRGEDLETVRLGTGASPLTVVLNLDTDEEYASYRAVLTRQGSAAPLWQEGQLQRQEHRVTFSLERRLVPPGDYRFDLYGLRGGREEPLGGYAVTINP